MASFLGNLQEWEHVVMSQMKEFPHFINLEAPFLTQERLQALLEALEEESDIDDISPEETIFKLNFKSWVYIRLANRKAAEQINNTVISKTKWKNIMSIENRVFLSWRAGKETEAIDCLSKLQDMKKLSDFNELLAVATAEQAYCYSRIGGPSNTFKAIHLLEGIVDKYPNKLFWKLRLGLEYRRSTHLNIYLEMPKGHSILDYLKKSVAILQDVIENSSDNRLRGPALSDLAILCRSAIYLVSKKDHEIIFHRRNPNELCDEALHYSGDSTWVLTNCGKLLRSCKNFDKAIEVLQICLALRKHTTTFHHLGLCYMEKAKLQAEKKTDSQSEKHITVAKGDIRKVAFRPYKQIKCYPADCTLQLKLPNQNFVEAKKQLLEAIKVSHSQNLPAMLHFGLLYNMAGLNNEALEMFNQIISNGGEGNMITVMSAYEQAGLCYLKMTDQKDLAEEKLTKAISLAVRAAASCPHLQDCATEVWHAFKTMKDEIEAEQPSFSKDKKLIKLLELVKNYHHVVEVVEKLLAYSDSQLKDPEVILSGLNGYLQLNKPEKALTFLNMMSMRPDITSSDSWRSKEMIDMRNKVFLLAAKNRLSIQSSEARFVFQELFKLHYGHCGGDIPETDTDVSDIGDVLLFYDDYHDTEELSPTSETVQSLQNVLSHVFGLRTNINLQGCLRYGPKMDVQLEEMKKYQVVIVILGEEERYCEFEELLKMIPFMRVASLPVQTVLVIDICSDRADIPSVLMHYGSFRLQDNMRSQIARGAHVDGDHNTVGNIITDVFGGDLDALMRLFCFIVQQNYDVETQ